MKDRVVCRLGIALAAASILVVTPTLAHAQQGAEGSAREQYSEAKNPTRNRSDESEGAREPLFVALDFMLGFGQYTSAVVLNPQPPDFQTMAQLDRTQIRTATFIIDAHYKFKKFGIGIRVPLVSGHVPRDAAIDSQDQDIFNPGNVEIAADIHHPISAEMKLVSSLALTLPTSPGSATPYSNQVLDKQLAGKSQPDQDTLTDAYARYAINTAAAFARGGEEDALFFNWRLGITPKIELKWNIGAHSHLEPYVKIPIMFGLEQNSAAQEPVRIELVPGVRFVQDIGFVHLGVKLVAMIPLAARDTLSTDSTIASRTPMLSIWPEIRLNITPSGQFWVAGMVPLAGDYSVFDSGKNNGAFNAGISATF